MHSSSIHLSSYSLDTVVRWLQSVRSLTDLSVLHHLRAVEETAILTPAAGGTLLVRPEFWHKYFHTPHRFTPEKNHTASLLSTRSAKPLGSLFVAAQGVLFMAWRLFFVLFKDSDGCFHPSATFNAP